MELRRLLGEIGQGRRQSTEILHELAIVAGRAEKGTHVAHILRLGPFSNGLHLVFHHAYAIATNHVTEKLDLTTKELTLALLCVQLFSSQDFQHASHMSCVILQGLRVDEYVVQEDQYEIIQVRTKCLMHQMHERAGCVGETEWEYHEFEVTVTRTKGGLRFVAGSDTNLVIARTQVELGEVSCTD